MKTKSAVFCRLGWLIAGVGVSLIPCRADDYITYSVPFTVPPPAASVEPHLSTTFSDTSGGNSLEVQKYTFDINGIGWSFNPDTGIGTEFGAIQYWFPHGNQMVPDGESDGHGHVDLWHNLTPDWTMSVGSTEDVAGDGRPYNGPAARTSFNVTVDYRPSDDFRAYFNLSEITIEGVSYVGPSVGYAWKFDPRWQLAGSFSYSIGTLFPRAVIRYKINDRLHLYGGLVTDGGIFHVNQARGYPGMRDDELYYYQNELKIGTDWAVSKGWDVGVSLGYSLRQRFSYHP